ncbi:MAG: 3'-5' exoribonuclease YhaM family protein [Desulfopila sp.]
MKKNKFIEELKEGDHVDDLFLVKTSKLAETRAGKPCLFLDLVDKSGEISGPVWDNAEKVAAISRVGDFLHLRAQVQSYRDKLQLRIEHIEAVDKAQVALADFVPSSVYDLDNMAQKFQKIVASVENPWIRKLLNRFFQNGKMWESFQTAPAAKGIHHAYVGGLLEHCLSMAGVADMLSKHYPGINRSLLLAGVFLHDIGKLQELQENTGLVEYTTVGRLKGHLVMGSELVAEQAHRIKEFPEELLLQIQHLILSHHGKQEFGSPAVPMTPEAFLLSFIDDLDSKMNLLEQLRRKQSAKGHLWTDYQRSLERFLYLGPLEQEPVEEQQPDLASRQRQKTLF